MNILTEQEIEEIRKNPNKQNWYLISSYQKLSESFIFEFFDKVNIGWILMYQTHLSIETRNKIKLIYKLSK